MAVMQRDTVEALAAGTATLKRVQREIGGVDRIQQILDEKNEAVEAQQELNAALSSAGIGDDDADALAELARLEAACAAEQLGRGSGGTPAAAAAPAPAPLQPTAAA